MTSCDGSNITFTPPTSCSRRPEVARFDDITPLRHWQPWQARSTFSIVSFEDPTVAQNSNSNSVIAFGRSISQEQGRAAPNLPSSLLPASLVLALIGIATILAFIIVSFWWLCKMDKNHDIHKESDVVATVSRSHGQSKRQRNRQLRAQRQADNAATVSPTQSAERAAHPSTAGKTVTQASPASEVLPVTWWGWLWARKASCFPALQSNTTPSPPATDCDSPSGASDNTSNLPDHSKTVSTAADVQRNPERDQKTSSSTQASASTNSTITTIVTQSFSQAVDSKLAPDASSHSTGSTDATIGNALAGHSVIRATRIMNFPRSFSIRQQLQFIVQVLLAGQPLVQAVVVQVADAAARALAQTQEQLAGTTAQLAGMMQTVVALTTTIVHLQQIIHDLRQQLERAEQGNATNTGSGVSGAGSSVHSAGTQTDGVDANTGNSNSHTAAQNPVVDRTSLSSTSPAKQQAPAKQDGTTTIHMTPEGLIASFRDDSAAIGHSKAPLGCEAERSDLSSDGSSSGGMTPALGGHSSLEHSDTSDSESVMAGAILVSGDESANTDDASDDESDDDDASSNSTAEETDVDDASGSGSAEETDDEGVAGSGNGTNTGGADAPSDPNAAAYAMIMDTLIGLKQAGVREVDQGHANLGGKMCDRLGDVLGGLAESKKPIISADKIDIDMERVIGEGTFAKVCHGVYLDDLDAVHERKPVAAKVFSGLSQDYSKTSSACSELLAFCYLVNFPNVLEMIGVYPIDEDTLAIILPLMDGNVLDWIKQKERSFRARVRMLIRMANGVVWMHKCGWIHRDLKPENFLCGQATTMVGDFGCACLAPVVGERWDYNGTAEYWAPEVIRGEGQTMASDVFAFGTIMVQVMLQRSTGQLVYNSDDVPGIKVQSILHANNFEAPALAALLPELDDRIRPLIDQCLNVDPELRPSMEGVLASLGACLNA